MTQVSVLPQGQDPVTRDDLAVILQDAAVAAEAGLATVDVLEAHVGVAAVAANVAAIGTTNDLTAVPASFADLAAVRTYLAGAGVLARVESRLDAVEAKADAIIAALVAAGLMAAS